MICIKMMMNTTLRYNSTKRCSIKSEYICVFSLRIICQVHSVGYTVLPIVHDYKRLGSLSHSLKTLALWEMVWKAKAERFTSFSIMTERTELTNYCINYYCLANSIAFYCCVDCWAMPVMWCSVIGAYWHPPIGGACGGGCPFTFGRVNTPKGGCRKIPERY